MTRAIMKHEAGLGKTPENTFWITQSERMDLISEFNKEYSVYGWVAWQRGTQGDRNAQVCKGKVPYMAMSIALTHDKDSFVYGLLKISNLKSYFLKRGYKIRLLYSDVYPRKCYKMNTPRARKRITIIVQNLRRTPPAGRFY